MVVVHVALQADINELATGGVVRTELLAGKTVCILLLLLCTYTVVAAGLFVRLRWCIVTGHALTVRG